MAEDVEQVPEGDVLIEGTEATEEVAADEGNTEDAA